MSLLIKKYILVLQGVLWFFSTLAVAGFAHAAQDALQKVPSSTVPALVVTLPELIEKAVQISPLVLSGEYSLEEAQATYAKSKSIAVLPKVDFSAFGGVVPDTPDNIGPAFGFPDAGLFDNGSWGPFVRMSLEVIQPIYTFGKISNLQKAAALGVQAGEEGIVRARNEMTLHAKKAYYALANLYSYLDFIEDLISRSQKAADIVRDKLAQRSSDVTDIDLMRIEVFQSETMRKKIEITHNIDFVKMTLKVLMGLPRDRQVDIVDHRIRMQENKIDSVDHFLQQAQINRPEVKQLRYLVQAKEFLMKEKKAQLKPSFGIAAQWGFGIAPGREDIDNPFLVNSFNRSAVGGSFFLQQNLAFHVLDKDYKKARAAFEKSKADQQAAFQGIEIEIRDAHKEVLILQDSFEHSKAAFKKVRSWVLATTLNFGVGVVAPKDLVEAFVAYAKVKNEYLETLYEFRMATAQLDFVVGENK